MTSVDNHGVVARPRASLLRNTVSSVLLFSIPLYGALYILGIPRGSWLVVFVTQLAGIALCALVWRRYRSVAVAVTETSVEEQGMFFHQRFPLDDARTVTMFQTYRSSSAETWRQLVVDDVDGNRLLRMRSIFWSEHDMRRIADAIGVPLTEPTEPMTSRAFAASHPGSVDWYERSRLLAGLTVAVLLAAAIGVVVGLMALAGVPIGGVA